MQNSFVRGLFYEEPSGTFSQGHILIHAVDLTSAKQDSDIGHWRWDFEDQDRLTWSEKVYEQFGLSAGTPVARDWAVAHYGEDSRVALDRVRNYAISRNFGFIFDLAIRPEGGGDRSIRVLAVPIRSGRRVVGFQGLTRTL